MLVFFDTEFTDLHPEARLISIGLIAEDGERSFYAELSDTYQEKDCSDFTRLAVLPLLEGGAVRMPMHELTVRLGNWLESFGEPVTLACDSLAWDWPWVQEIFDIEGTWPANVAQRPLLLTINYLYEYDRFVDAVDLAFKGLRQHHSLDDAKANRRGWFAAAGDIDQADRLRAAKRLTPPSESEQALWCECMDTETGQHAWEPRLMSVNWNRHQLVRRGILVEVCQQCGTKHGKHPADEGTTWHEGRCDLCGAEGPVTEPRNLGMDGPLP